MLPHYRRRLTHSWCAQDARSGMLTLGSRPETKTELAKEEMSYRVF